MKKYTIVDPNTVRLVLGETEEWTERVERLGSVEFNGRRFTKSEFGKFLTEAWKVYISKTPDEGTIEHLESRVFDKWVDRGLIFPC